MRNNILNIESQKYITKGNRPITFLTVVFALTSVVLIWVGWDAWSSYRTTRADSGHYLKIERLHHTIIHLGEVLTMSARMAAVTGNLRWEQRYRSFEPKLDAAIKGSLELAPEAYSGEAAAATEAANIRLVEMENHSFDLVRQGRIDEAKTLLFSNEYDLQKKIYAQGMVDFATVLSNKASANFKDVQRKAFLHVGIIFLLIPTQIIVWFIALQFVRNWRKTLIDKKALEKEIAERKQAEKALRESEEKYRRVIQSALVGVYQVSQEGRFTMANQRMADIFGFDSPDKLITDVEDIANLYARPEERPTILREIDEKGFLADKEVELRKKDGTSIWAKLNTKAFRVKENTFYEGFIQDITRQRGLEAKLQQSQKMESIGNLAGGIAHDFNNILFPVVGLSEMLLEDLTPGGLEHENAQEIFKAGKRGRDLVKQILAFSRQSNHEMMPVRIQQVLNEVLKLSRSTIPTNIEIAQDIQSNCGLVMADPTQVHQVAMNLITNAFHSVEQTDGKITVQLRETELGSSDLKDSSLTSGQYAMLSVSDTGGGIDPSVMDKIYDPYFTTKEAGKGTGLGLAVVFGIIKEHHGDIKVYSEPGKGTTFSVYLPLKGATDETVSDGKVKTFETGSERILIVDDEEPIIHLERQVLERLGYHVTSRLSSIDALEAFRANPNAFDLVVTDMSMPNMTGDQLAKELISVKPGIPIIACTGFSERMSQGKADAMNIKGLLMKPIVKSEMAHMVRKVLDEDKDFIQRQSP